MNEPIITNAMLREQDQERIAALEANLAAITRVASEYQKEAGESTAELAAAQAERDKWKAMAEWQYGVRVCPHDMTLSKGALDIYIEKWLTDAAIDQAKEKT